LLRLETQITVISALLFTGFSFGSALAPSLVGYFVFRILTACVSMVFLIIGASCIGDIYIPVRAFFSLADSLKKRNFLSSKLTQQHTLSSKKEVRRSACF